MAKQELCKSCDEMSYYKSYRAFNDTDNDEEVLFHECMLCGATRIIKQRQTNKKIAKDRRAEEFNSLIEDILK
jgi:RNase P subunit RPR2